MGGQTSTEVRSRLGGVWEVFWEKTACELHPGAWWVYVTETIPNVPASQDVFSLILGLWAHIWELCHCPLGSLIQLHWMMEGGASRAKQSNPHVGWLVRAIVWGGCSPRQHPLGPQ